MEIRLQLLGGLHVFVDGRERIALQQHRSLLAVIVYLAVERRVRRDCAMALLWPESDTANARHALRQALYRLRQEIGAGDWLEVHRDELIAAASLSCDVREFEAATAGGEHAAAAGLYAGPFLHAVHLAGAQPWESWVDGHRARLARAHRLNCRAWVDACVGAGDPRGAVAAAHAWVAPDPFEDEAQHRLIELLAASGDRTGALRQYERYERLIAADGLTPLDRTVELYRSLRTAAQPEGSELVVTRGEALDSTTEPLADQFPDDETEPPARLHPAVEVNDRGPLRWGWLRRRRFVPAGAAAASVGEFADALMGARPVVAPQVRAAGALTPEAELPARKGARLRLGVPAAAALVAALVMLVGAWLLWPRTATRDVVRFPVPPPVSFSIGRGTSTFPNDPDLAISRDGRHIAYRAVRDAAPNVLFVQTLAELEPRLIPGVVLPRAPFFSPDGTWIGYFTGDPPATSALRKVPVAGGPAVTLLNLPADGRGASWGPGDRIVFATSDAATGLSWFSASGGDPEVLTTPDHAAGEVDHILPEFLPDGNAILFTIVTAGGTEDWKVAVLDLADRSVKVLVDGGTNPRFAASGHLIYASSGTLYAVRFDPGRLEIRGNRAPIAEGVLTKSGGAANYGMSLTGTLVYQQQWSASARRALLWVDRAGAEERIDAPPRTYVYPRVSPDGRQLAIDVRDQDNDIWTWDFERGVLARVTTASVNDQYPVWSPDGRQIVFRSRRPGGDHLFVVPADGGGPVLLLAATPAPPQPYSFSPDSMLVFGMSDSKTDSDLYMLSLADGAAIRPLIRTQFRERNAEISPDGQWVVYQSNFSGRDEVYVSPFPDADGGRSLISTAGGKQPLWARNGRELFYLSPDGILMAVDVQVSIGTFLAGTPTRVLNKAYRHSFDGRTYDVSPDGKRFLVIEKAADDFDGTQHPSHLVVVLNWFPGRASQATTR